MRLRLRREGDGGRTVTMTETMIMRMLAMPEMIALIAPPIAEKMAPCLTEYKFQKNIRPTSSQTYHDGKTWWVVKVVIRVSRGGGRS